MSECVTEITPWSTVRAQLLEYILQVVTNLTAPLLGIGPRRCWRRMGIQHGQCLLGILPGQILLPVRQISFREVGMRVGRIRVSEPVKLEDLDRWFGFACAQMIIANDVEGNFRPQLRFW